MEFKVSGDACKDAYWFLFCNDELLVAENAGFINTPWICGSKMHNFTPAGAQYIGSLDGHQCYVAKLGSKDVPPGFTFKELRQLYSQVADEYFWFAARAFHIMHWLRNNEFCGRCGSGMQASAEELAVECAHCRQIVYPRISPAVIVAVIREDKILLARSARFPAVYSVIAGFVEPGETFEDCINRELQEEVGITVTNIKYFGNQPWPFPDSLMVAFTAQYAQGNITIDNKEIIEAGWFSARELPSIPPKVSIARQLIDWFAKLKKPQ